MCAVFLLSFMCISFGGGCPVCVHYICTHIHMRAKTSEAAIVWLPDGERQLAAEDPDAEKD